MKEVDLTHDTLYQFDEEFRNGIATVDAQGKRVWVYPKKPRGIHHRWRILVTVILLSLFSFTITSMMFDPKVIQKLRAETGSGIMDCRKILEEAGGDYDKAIELLRKRGQKVAANKADRETHEKMGFHQGWGICADQLTELVAKL